MNGSRRPSHGSRNAAGIRVRLSILSGYGQQGEAAQVAVWRLLEPDGRAWALEDAGGARHHALGHVDRTACLGEVAREREERLRALGLAPLGLVEAGVLERNRRVSRHHLEQSQVVGVELVEAELRDHDHAGDARSVSQRDGEQRLLDLRGPGDLLAELVTRSVDDEEGNAGLGDAARYAAAHARR